MQSAHRGFIPFRCAFLILLFIFLLPSSRAFAAEDLASILSGIRDRYGPLPGLTVPYEREIITRSMAMLGEAVKGDFATGKILFKPPHFLRVQQETPKPEAVISNGDTLWWYIPEKKQAYRYASFKLGKELKLLGDIFQGLRGVEESFVVVLHGRDERGDLQLELTPEPAWPDIDHINLSVDPKGYGIRRVEITNLLGGLTRFNLGEMVVREGFDKDVFSFVPPEGVRVIKED